MHHVWFAKVIVFGELLVGIGLIVALWWACSLLGALMNMSFMLAGSASTNPVLFLLAGAADPGLEERGYLGLDRILAASPRHAWRQRVMRLAPTPVVIPQPT